MIQAKSREEISDGAGNRIVKNEAGAKPGNKRPVMFVEDSNSSVQFTFNVSEGQDPEQLVLVNRVRSEINTWSSPETTRHTRSGAAGKRPGPRRW